MAGTHELVAYIDGSIVPSGEISPVGPGEPEPAGGVYDAERTFGGQVFKLRNHIQRLYRSLGQARMDPGISIEEMEASTIRVLEANRPLLKETDDFIISQLVSVGNPSAAGADAGSRVVISCQLIDFSSFAHSYVRGVKVVTPVTYTVPVQSVAAEGDRAAQETYMLLTNDKGDVTECRHANFMFVRDGRIKLPDRRNVLAGISMETLLELAEADGIPVDEGDYSSREVYEADEVFVTGTRYCLLPVATLNGVNLGEELPGSVTHRLQTAWSDRVGLDFVQQALDHLHDEDRIESPFSG